MYSKEAIFRKIKQMGPTGFINFISSTNLPENLVKQLEECRLIENGKLCTSKIFLLASI